MASGFFAQCIQTLSECDTHQCEYTWEIDSTVAPEQKGYDLKGGSTVRHPKLPNSWTNNEHISYI